GRYTTRKIVLSWLIIASLVFYAWWNPPYVFLVIGSIVVNYLLSLLILRNRSRVLLALGVAFNLALLGYFKYANFFITNLDVLFDADWTVGNIILPLAISFFTFTQIAFLVDCYRGQDWTRGSLEYAGFVTFFPHLFMGPIVLHRELAPQFQSSRFGRVKIDDIAPGLRLFIIGLFKKILIADSISPYSDQVFLAAAQGQAPGFYAGWLGILAFTIQVYFDFSAYSDMALGVSR